MLWTAKQSKQVIFPFLVFSLLVLSFLYPFFSSSSLSVSPGQNLSLSSPNWATSARIAYVDLYVGMSTTEMSNAADELIAQHVSVAYTDLGFTNQYDIWKDPSAYLDLLQSWVNVAQTKGLKTFTYLSGFEIQTPKDVTPKLSEEHSDWIQMDKNGHKAIFNSSNAFWIEEGEEDVWVTPLATEWRTHYLDIVKNVTATGIDAIYIDVPYWMTHFEGWEDSWTSFDPYTLAEFKARTGYDAPSSFDFDDPVFRAWLNFRREVIHDFFKDVQLAARSINYNILVIPELYGSFTSFSTFTAADTFFLHDVTNGTAHEFSQHETTLENSLGDWLTLSASLEVMRALDGSNPTWALTYASDPADGAVLHCLEALHGVGTWEHKPPGMGDTLGLDFRTAIFNWIESLTPQLYGNWSLIQPVGVYFSPYTKNYQVLYSDTFDPPYSGFITTQHELEFYATVLLLQTAHIPIQVITPTQLLTMDSDELPKWIIFPNVSMMSQEEITKLQALVNSISFLILGPNAQVYLNGSETGSTLPALVGIDPSEGIHGSHVVRGLISSPFYLALLNDDTLPSSDHQLLQDLNAIGYVSPLSTDAPGTILLIPYKQGNAVSLRVFNFQGLQKNTVQNEFTAVSFSLTYLNKTISLNLDSVERAGVVYWEDFLTSQPSISMYHGDEIGTISPTTGTTSSSSSSSSSSSTSGASSSLSSSSPPASSTSSLLSSIPGTSSSSSISSSAATESEEGVDEGGFLFTSSFLWIFTTLVLITLPSRLKKQK